MLTITERAQLQEVLRSIMKNDDKKINDWSEECGCKFKSNEKNCDENYGYLNTTATNVNEYDSRKFENPWNEKKVESLLEEESSDESIQTFHVDKKDLVASEDDSVDGNLFITPDPSIDIPEDETAEQNIPDDDPDYDFIGMFYLLRLG